MKIAVDNRVRIPVDGLPAEVRRGLEEAFEHTNPQNAMKKRLLQKVPRWVIDKQEPPMIRTWEESRTNAGTWLSLPRGGMGKVRKILTENGVDWEVCDERFEAIGKEGGIPDHRVQLWPHQERIVEAAIQREQCLIRSGTGSGKTTALIAIASRLKVPTLVVVHSRALFDQWLERLWKELGLEPRDVGEIRGRRARVRPITLAVQKGVPDAASHVADYFGCIIADEVHLFAARTFFASIDPFPARYRIGASADHRRKDRKEFLIHDLFGDVAVDIPREELVAGGHVLDVEVRVVPTDFAAPWYGMPSAGAEQKRIDFIRLVKEMMADERRNELVFDIVEEEAGEQILVMVHEREHACAIHAELIARGESAGLLLGGQTSEAEFRRTLEGIRGGRIRIGVGTYKAIGTGIDLPRVAVGIGVTPIAANEQFFGQVRGRVCRTAEGKTGARLYYLWDREVYGARHLENVARWNPKTVVRAAREWVDAKEFLKGART